MLANIRKRLVFLLSLFWAPLALAGATPIPGSESVPELFAAASVVFKGEIVSVVPVREIPVPGSDGSIRATEFAATARVDRIYKGPNSLETVRIVIARPKGTACNVSPCESLDVGEYDLFFLSGAGSDYHLLDLFFGKFPVSRRNATSKSAGLAALEADLTAALHDSDERLQLKAAQLLGAMGHLNSTEPLHELLSSHNPRLQVTAAAALLHLGDYSALEAAGRTLEMKTSDPQIVRLQFQISTWIEEIRTPSAVPVLIKLTQSQSDSLREAAIHALREIAHPTAVPVFVAALDDPVSSIRYDAVLGLASIEKNWDLAPSIDAFEAAESKYIGAWKSWWIRTAPLPPDLSIVDSQDIFPGGLFNRNNTLTFSSTTVTITNNGPFN